MLHEALADEHGMGAMFGRRMSEVRRHDRRCVTHHTPMLGTRCESGAAGVNDIGGDFMYILALR